MIEIRPISPDMVEVLVNGKKLQDAFQDEIIDNMEDFADAYPGQSKVTIRANRFRMTAPVVEKALELAGLDGLAAAKQQSTGKVVF